MAFTITTPGTNYLPGKDDNIYSILGDNAGNVNYIYTVKLKINNVVKEVLSYQTLGATEPIKINIKHLIRPYLSIPTMESQSVLQAYYGCIKVELVISGTDGTNTDTETTSSARYYYNGTSPNFWSEKLNNSIIQAYIPSGTELGDRAQWVGPMRPSSSTILFTNPFAPPIKITGAAKNEAYHISPYASGTACLVQCYNGDQGEEDQPWANMLNIYCFNKDGVITKWLYTDLSLPRISDYRNKFMTIPIGIQQINSLISSFTFQIFDIHVGNTIDPNYEKYYAFIATNSNNNSICTLPLVFEICPEPAPQKIWDMRNVSILYYSKLGAWWQLPGHCKNIRDTEVKSSIMNKSVTATGKGTYSRNKNVVHVDTADTIIVNTDWVPLNALQEYEDLTQSPEIWLTYGGFYIPVVLQDASYRFDATNIKELVQYTLKFTAAYNKQTIL